MRWISIFATIGLTTAMANFIIESYQIKLINALIMGLCVIAVVCLDIKLKRTNNK